MEKSRKAAKDNQDGAGKREKSVNNIGGVIEDDNAGAQGNQEMGSEGNGSEAGEDKDENLMDIVGGMQGIRDVGQSAARAAAIVDEHRRKKQRAVQLESLDLQDLGFLRNISWNNLEEIYLNRNMINNIDLLGRFTNLRVIDASNNYIEEVILFLERLERLDLSNNYLKEFPLLENGMKKLKILNLNSNRLVGIRQVIIDYTPNIKSLDLGANMIDFDNFDEFSAFLAKLNQWPQLSNLFVEENPFFSAENIRKYKNINIIQEFITKLKSLEYFNGDDMGAVRHQLKTSQIEHQLRKDNEDRGGAANIYDQLEAARMQDSSTDIAGVGIQGAAPAEAQKKSRKKKIQPPRSLATLLYNVEAANGHPSFALDHLHDLSKDVDELVEKIHMIENHFAPGKEKAEIQEMIETFMQNTLLLIDNHFELQTIMLSVLAKLSIINFQDFGLSCFNTLKDLMKAGREMELQVQEVLKNEVINKMKQQDPTVIPVSLLVGLCELVEDTELSSLLSGMYEMCFPVWLRLYCEKLEQCRLKNEFFGNDAHYDAIISLLSISTKENEENRGKVLDKNLVPFITKIIKQSSWEHDRYIPCLNLIARLSKGDGKAADLFMENFVHTILLTQIKKSMTVYKKHNSLSDEINKDTVEQTMLKYQTLAAEIVTLGALLQAHSRMQIIIEPVVLEIIAIMSHYKTDPILLTAVCTFALDLFQCKELRYRKRFMEPFFTKMANMQYMVSYMGFDRYPDLLQMSKKYHEAKNPRSRADDAGASDGKQGGDKDASDMFNTKNAAKQQQQITASLAHLDDPIVNELFISIIHLMRYFCLEADQNRDNDLFDDISQSLNDNHREDALFKCLIIPDDEVRLAVVECLFVVPLDEFDSEEIARITKIMSSCSNIGAGKTELVLSTIYWICTKLVMVDRQDVESSQIFQRKFGEKATEEALNILQRNLVRVVDVAEEDEEKYALSLSIINFLKAASLSPIMQQYLRNAKSSAFRQILINEDLHSSERVKTVPVDIENSWIGREMKCLIDTVTDVDTIQPYCDVSLRVLMRMADVLMCRNEYPFYDITQDEDVTGELMKFQEKVYRKKKDQELDYWVDLPNSFMEQLDPEARADLKRQHICFTVTSNGVALLQIFLTTKYHINEEYVKHYADKWFDKMRNIGQEKSELDKGVDAMKQTLEGKFYDGYGRKDDPTSIRGRFHEKNQKGHGSDQAAGGRKPGEEEDPDAPKGCQPTNQPKFKDVLCYEELGKEYANSMLGDGGGQGRTDDEWAQFEQQIEQLKKNDPNTARQRQKEKRGDGFLNAKLRSLTVAAYLRCLYGSIEYAPTVGLKQRAIQNILDPHMFKAVTQLCDAADWDDTAHIGAKYLRVVRHVIKLPFERECEDGRMLMHYELIAMVIQRTLSKIMDKMKKDIQLTEGDQITIYEISLTFFIVIQQSNNFLFSDTNLIHTHLEKEFQLAEIAAGRGTPGGGGLTPGEDGSGLALAKEVKMDLPWKKKCEFEAVDKESQRSPGTYKVDLASLRGKRSAQNKVVEYMILELFSKQSIFSLIDILFNDMSDDYKLIEKENDNEDEEDGEPDPGDQGEEAKGEDEDGIKGDDEEEEDPTKYGVDIDDYTKVKGVLTIERIKDIVGEIMSSCQKKMKYEILQNIMKGVIYEKKKLRESFMQEILNATDNASFRSALEQYIRENQLAFEANTCVKWPETPRPSRPPPGTITDDHSDRVRILILSKVDLLDSCTSPKKVGVDKDVPPEFKNRLLVLTNQGILIMKTMPSTSKEKCLKCPPQAFCPRGPKYEIGIRYSDVKSVINFPQLPQKLVIIYKCDKSHAEEAKQPQQADEEDASAEQDVGSQEFLTLNIPLFTKSAKIYLSLKDILKKIEHEWPNGAPVGGGKSVRQGNAAKLQKGGADMGGEEEEDDTRLKTNYQDLLAQYELRSIIKQIAPKLKKRTINQLQLISASLVDTTLISNKFFDEHVRSKQKAKAKGGWGFARVDPFDEEDELQIANAVYVCIIGGFVILLKENWDKWAFQPDGKALKPYLKAKEKGDEKENAGKPTPPAGGNEDVGLVPDEKEGETVAQFQKRLEAAVISLQKPSALFKLITWVKVEDVRSLQIHRGKDPSVNLSCFKAGNDYTMKILFTGDMERQKFVEALIHRHGKTGEEEDEEEDDEDVDKGAAEARSNDSFDVKSESEEEITPPTIYD